MAANWYPLPDTGLTKCHDDNGNEIACPTAGQPFYGQDAQYTSGKPSYADLGDGTVKNHNTGLIWQQIDDGVKRTWQDATDYCDTLVLAGNSNWRLPNIFELYSILDYSNNHYPYCFMDTDFFECLNGNILDGGYWSNTIGFNSFSSVSVAWVLYDSSSMSSNVANEELVRCVSGEETSLNNFSLAGGGMTVNDSITELEWQREDDGITRTWKDALAYCEDLALAGHDDWRVPNIKELNSIVDQTEYDPAINSLFSSKSDSYWSSTSAINSFNAYYFTIASSVDFKEGGYISLHHTLNSKFVRCVRGGLLDDNITAKNYRFGNIDPRSDRFSVWMDISINGRKPIEEFCNYYQLQVNGDNGKGATQLKCTALDDAPSQPANTGRYRIDFEIDKDATYPTAAYFENGKMKVRNINTGSETILSDLTDFSVYGTTFDLSLDAWSFANGSWVVAKDSAEKYRKILANEVDDEEQRETPMEGKGEDTREDFNAAVGFEELIFYPLIGYVDRKSAGLCYGLASSAIANFTKKDSFDFWGSGGEKSWKFDIDSHWDKNKNYAVYPFKPFKNGKLYDLTWNDSSKMIMYYYLSQKFFLNSSPERINNWVGKDVDMDWQPSKRSDELFLANILLKKGRPALFSFLNGSGGGHAINLVQLIRYNQESTYVFYDNIYPYNGTENFKKSPYVEWKIKDINFGGKYDPELDFIYRIEDIESRMAVLKYSIKDIDILLPCSKKSQNIYGLWGESCPELPVAEAAASIKSASAQQATAASVSYNTPDYIKVMFIGGAIEGIYNQNTGAKITPAFSDTLQNGQAVIQSTMGGTYHLIHLPADAAYRIEATKAADMPYAEVYASIPNPNGTVDKLHYDNIGFSETDATKFSFVVGRGNSDTTMRRTGGSDKTPDYAINLEMAITPPSEFAGLSSAGQIQLRWKNTSHPSLSLVKIVRKEGGFPTSATDGVEIYSGLGEAATDSTAQGGSLYYYAAFSMDSKGNFSERAAAFIDTSRFAVTGKVTNGGAGVPNAKVEIRNSEQFPIAMTYTGNDGRYIFANLENGSYTVTAEASGYHVDSSPKSVAITTANQIADFTSAAVPTLQLVFDIDKLNIGTQAQIAWKYLHVSRDETILVQKVSGGIVTNLKELPASTNYFLWNVDGPVNQTVTIKVSLKSNPAVTAQDELTILPATAGSSQSILPAINLLLKKKH